MKYREQIYEIVGQVVREQRTRARDVVSDYANQHVAREEDRATFVSIVMGPFSPFSP